MTMQAVILLCLQASIVGTVFSFGLQASMSDVLLLLRHPGLLLRSALAVFVVMPLVAMFIVEVFALDKATEIALIALALSPIPPLLPRKESKAGGEGAYALGLMVLMGVLAIVIVPLLVALLGTFYNRDFGMSPLAIAKVVVIMIVLPLLAGMALRAAAPGLTAKLARPLALLSSLLLAGTVALILYAVLPGVIKLMHNGTLLAVAAFIAIGLGVGHFLGGPVPERRTVLAISTASRHPAIALAIAKTNFPGEPFIDATIVLYLIVVTVMAIPYIQWRRHEASTVGRRTG